MMLQHLITFARVVELGSFTRAGELLNLSQPAVTRQVAALEGEFGVPLIERSGRSIAVTPAGQVVYSAARRIAALVERAKIDVVSLSHPERGLVSVAAVTTVGLFTLPGLLAEFRERYPQVRFRVWSGCSVRRSRTRGWSASRCSTIRWCWWRRRRWRAACPTRCRWSSSPSWT